MDGMPSAGDAVTTGGDPGVPVAADRDATVPDGSAQVPGGVLLTRRGATPFEVHLDVFSGPFELLLGLIAKHKLDVTEIALAQVTDEFVAHLRAAQDAGLDWDLSQASDFLLVAATLLELKAARLLPTTRDDAEEDLELIEARDLLFARLLQYRAFKQVAATFEERMATVGRIFPRDVGMEEQFTRLLPELVMTITPDQLAAIAARAMIPKPPPSVGLTHLHAPQVSVREQAEVVVGLLRGRGAVDFAELVRDADTTLVIVARFLALLELYREQVVSLDQSEALARLTVRWTGPEEGTVDVGDEFDEDDEDVAGHRHGQDDAGDRGQDDERGQVAREERQR